MHCRLCINCYGTGARICKRLWSPGIDSEESISPAYVACRVGTTNRVVVPARQPENRFLGSMKGLQIRARVVNEFVGEWKAAIPHPLLLPLA